MALKDAAEDEQMPWARRGAPGQGRVVERPVALPLRREAGGRDSDPEHAGLWA